MDLIIDSGISSDIDCISTSPISSIHSEHTLEPQKPPPVQRVNFPIPYYSFDPKMNKVFFHSFGTSIPGFLLKQFGYSSSCC